MEVDPQVPGHHLEVDHRDRVVPRVLQLCSDATSLLACATLVPRSSQNRTPDRPVDVSALVLAGKVLDPALLAPHLHVVHSHLLHVGPVPGGQLSVGGGSQLNRPRTELHKDLNKNFVDQRKRQICALEPDDLTVVSNRTCSGKADAKQVLDVPVSVLRPPVVNGWVEQKGDGLGYLQNMYFASCSTFWVPNQIFFC